MLVLRTDYFEQFSCVAGKCLESCCINWKIDVDKLSFQKYREVKGEFGKYLCNTCKQYPRYIYKYGD